MVSTPLIVPIALRPGAVLGGLMVCSRKPQPTSIVPIAPRGHAVHDALRHLFSGISGWTFVITGQVLVRTGK